MRPKPGPRTIKYQRGYCGRADVWKAPASCRYRLTVSIWQLAFSMSQGPSIKLVPPNTIADFSILEDSTTAISSFFLAGVFLGFVL